MTKIRDLYKYHAKTKEFLHIVKQGEDIEEGKIQGKTIFPNMINATPVAPPNYNQNIQIAIFKNDNWELEDRKIKGKFYLKKNGLSVDSIFVKEISEYTDIEPQKTYSGSLQEFKSNKWVYTFKGGTQIEAERKQELESLKVGKLQELQKLYEISKKITIQNGKTLVIEANTPERKYFIQNLELTPKLDNILKNKFT